MTSIVLTREFERFLTSDLRPMRVYKKIVRPKVDAAVWFFMSSRKRRRIDYLPVPGNIQRGVRQFVRRFHRDGVRSLDCYAFVNLAHGLSLHPVSRSPEFWDLALLRKWPCPGEVVFLETVSPLEDQTLHRFHHAAICMKDDFFISICGLGGYLEVATLDDMVHDFGAKHVYIAKPKKES